MKIYIILGLVAAVLVMTVTAWLILGNSSFLGIRAEQLSINVENEDNVDDRCWFNTREGIDAGDLKALNKIRDRQLFGFTEETALSEAVRIFNHEVIQCTPYFKEYPPLTEDELIAAIIVGVNENQRGTVFHKERDALWSIVTKRMMPKGSVLSAHTGGNIQESPLAPYKTINAKGIEIFLQLGADKEGRTGLAAPFKPEEVIVIRKTFSGIEIK